MEEIKWHALHGKYKWTISSICDFRDLVWTGKKELKKVWRPMFKHQQQQQKNREKMIVFKRQGIGVDRA